MKKIFDIVCVLISTIFITCGIFAMCGFIATDAQCAYGHTAGIVTFFGVLIIAIASLVRWLILLQK